MQKIPKSASTFSACVTLDISSVMHIYEITRKLFRKSGERALKPFNFIDLNPLKSPRSGKFRFEKNVTNPRKNPRECIHILDVCPDLCREKPDSKWVPFPEFFSGCGAENPPATLWEE